MQVGFYRRIVASKLNCKGQGSLHSQTKPHLTWDGTNNLTAIHLPKSEQI